MATKKFSRIATAALLCLGMSAGCGGWFSQMRAVSRAVEGKNYPVEKVGISKANGQKTVTVYTENPVDEAGKAEISDIVKTVVPDANNVQVLDKPKANPNSTPRANHG